MTPCFFPLSLVSFTNFARVLVVSASPPHWDTVAPDAWALASAPEAIMRPLAEGPRISRDAADAAVAALGIRVVPTSLTFPARVGAGQRLTN